MKIKIEKEWFLISLASALAIHSYDMFFVFMNYLPKASGYKNPMWIWLLQLLQTGLPIVVWILLLIRHSKLLLFLRILLLFVLISRILPNFYFAYMNFIDNYFRYGLNQLFTGIVYLFFGLLINFFGSRYIVEFNDDSSAFKQRSWENCVWANSSFWNAFLWWIKRDALIQVYLFTPYWISAGCRFS